MVVEREGESRWKTRDVERLRGERERGCRKRREIGGNYSRTIGKKQASDGEKVGKIERRGVMEGYMSGEKWVALEGVSSGQRK